MPRTTLIVLLPLLAACGGAELRTASPDMPRCDAAAATIEPEVLDAVARVELLRGYGLAPLGQYERGSRIVAIVWPAFDRQGELVEDDEIIGITLEQRAGGALRVIGRPWDAQRGGRARLVEELGGEGFRLRGRARGLPLDTVGACLESWPERFADAVRRGDRDAALAVAAELAGVYPSHQPNQYDNIAELLVGGTMGGELEHEATEARLLLRVRYRGETREDSAPLRLAGGERWVIGRAR